MVLSLNVLGINVGGLIETCLQILDNVLVIQNASNNKNVVRRQSEYHVSLLDVQQQPITTGDRHSWLQQQQSKQQSLEQLQPLVQNILQLTQIQQILQHLVPLLQQSSQLTQLTETQPSFNFGINTTSLLDDNTNIKNKLTDNQKVIRSPDSIRKPTVVIPGSNALRKSSKTKEIIFDISEGNDITEVVIDMRGIKKQRQKDIIIDMYNDSQLIVSDPAKSYNVEIMLPSKVVSEPLRKVYKNGILTLKFKKLQKQQQQLQQLQQLLQQLQQILQQQQQ
jgi:HSP20 family molecular chaperone IbpA